MKSADLRALDTRAALDLWRRALAAGLSREGGELTQRQMALLLTVYLTPAPHTVRALAASLKMPKPAASRAVDRLAQFDLVRRKRDDADRRSVIVQRTLRGAGFLRDFADTIAKAARSLADQ